MTTIVTRLYAAEDKAVAAVSALKLRFSENEINLVTPASGKDAAETEAAIASGGVEPSAAAVYAEKVGQGNSLVTVRAALGFATEARKALDRAGPIDGGEETFEPATSRLSEAAPFSAWTGWPVLIGRGEKTSEKATGLDEAAPFSSWAGWPVLIKFKSNIVLKKDPAPFSRWANWPLLSKSATPLSDFLHLPVLWKDRSRRP